MRLADPFTLPKNRSTNYSPSTFFKITMTIQEPYLFGTGVVKSKDWLWDSIDSKRLRVAFVSWNTIHIKMRWTV